MEEFKHIIENALDILKFDGAVQDTLARLREKWGPQVPALLDERFDAVGVQYMKLPHEKGAAALGQELSAFGWALYNLDDEDEYLFALIPEEERNEWERYCKKQGQYCHLMKQQGRKCALPGFVDSKNEEKTERNAGYLVVSQSGGGMLRQGTREGIRRTPANRGMRAHWVVKGLDISEDVCHGMCP